MDNRDTRAALRFHDSTKYSLVGAGERDGDILMGAPPDLGPAIGEQDPAIEPLPYKIYTTLDPIELSREFPPFTMPALDALAATGDLPVARAVPSRDQLARLCLLSNGILKRGGHGTGRVIEYRAAGGTGARYHIELYLVCGDLPGLDAGVYQYAAHDHSLRRLREGDYRAVLAEATGAEPSIVRAPVVVAVTSTFWRNAWRYQGRAYRHSYWDLGTTLSNLLAVAASSQLPARVVMGFSEGQVNQLLDVDGERESAVCLVALGRDGAPARAAPSVEPLDLPTRPISAREIVFPEITAMHTASSLASGAEVAEWRSRPLRRSLPEPQSEVIGLRPLGPGEIPEVPIDEVIRRRRSTRHYAAEVPVGFEAFSTLLDRSSRGVAVDCLDPSGPALNDQYVIANNVEGLDRGAYVLYPRRSGLEPLAAGDMRAAAAGLACGQEYAAEAHANVYYLADLEPILERYGNRGYRVAQTEAALFAGKLHLATHALGLGAVGSTSVDDEVIRFFSPHAEGKSYMFVIVFGIRRKRTPSGGPDRRPTS
jgi:SagB-type dehydrogenase family enzyme